MGALKERMAADLRLRNYSVRTQRAYLRCAERLAAFHMRSPSELSSEDLRTYLVHLQAEAKLAARSLGVHICALRFLYRVSLGQPEVVERLRQPRVKQNLPVVLSGTEVSRLLAAVTSFRYRALLTTTYAAGLRLGEACQLTVSDIDSQRMLIHVPLSKTGERYAMLSPRLLEVLREYYRRFRPKGPFLFPGRWPDRPVTQRGVRRVIKEAAKQCGLTKNVSPHTLRHSFATHLLETGTDIRMIQALLGHRSIRSTLIYAQVTPHHVARIKSPLDLLGTRYGKALG